MNFQHNYHGKGRLKNFVENKPWLMKGVYKTGRIFAMGGYRRDFDRQILGLFWPPTYPPQTSKVNKKKSFSLKPWTFEWSPTPSCLRSFWVLPLVKEVLFQLIVQGNKHAHFLSWFKEVYIWALQWFHSFLTFFGKLVEKKIKKKSPSRVPYTSNIFAVIGTTFCCTFFSRWTADVLLTTIGHIQQIDVLWLK